MMKPLEKKFYGVTTVPENGRSSEWSLTSIRKGYKNQWNLFSSGQFTAPLHLLLLKSIPKTSKGLSRILKKYIKSFSQEIPSSILFWKINIAASIMMIHDLER